MDLENVERLNSLFSEQLKETHKFFQNKDERKIQLFKINITLFSLFSTSIIAIFTIISRPYNKLPDGNIFILSILLTAISFGLAFIYYVIVKQYSEAHEGQILAARKMNLLRKSQATLVYFCVEKKFPENITKLKEKQTKYWEYFGCTQGEIDNIGLIARESRILYTNAGITMIFMLIMSSLSLMLPFIYYLLQEQNHIFTFLSGSFTTLLFLVTLGKIKKSHNKVLSILKNN